MKKITRNIMAMMIFGGAVLASQSVFGQVVADDLYLGFENQYGKGTHDYIINLGPTNGIVGGSSVVNLSSDFSFANYLSLVNTTTNVVAIYGGVVGGNNSESPSDYYVTQFRTGGAGIPSVSGSGFMTNLTSDVFVDTPVANDIFEINAPAAGTGLSDSSKSWEQYIEPTFAVGSFYGDSSLNPDSLVASNAVVYEDLWYTASASTVKKHFSYEGYFTISPNGATTVTFTPANTPAPLTSPKIISISYNLAGTTVTVVSSNAVPTHLYQLQRAASLASPVAWSNVGAQATAIGTLVTNTDTAATSSQSFYQVTGQ